MKARALLLAVVLLSPVSQAANAPAEESRAARDAAIVGPRGERLPDGHYRVELEDGTVLFTHGPDPEPTHGGTIGPGDPERPPLCATDYYQHVLYGRPHTSADRFTSVKPTIVSAIRRMNAILNEDAIASGQMNADYKVKCDASGELDIGRFVAVGNSYDAIVTGARNAGFTASNADYTIFYDAAPAGACGIASRIQDDRAGASNPNNNGGGYAVSYSNCWTNEAPMHENGHNQGAVPSSAPYSTQAGHCYDENDVMCYADGGPRGGSTISRCTDAIHFDCGYDTYFDAAPEAGEWLSTHWNIGSSVNRFIVLVPASRPPSTGFSTSCSNMTCSFGDLSTDEGTITSWSWEFGDGAVSSQQSPTHTFSAEGTYLVELTTTDDKSMSSSSVMTVTVPSTGDPDPSAPTLTNGVAATQTSARNQQWRYHKIFVPQGRPTLTVRVTASACRAFVCNPDLDLFVRQGQRPERASAACSSQGLQNTETCSVTLPGPGYWYVGVYTALGVPAPVIDPFSVQYTVTATY